VDFFDAQIEDGLAAPAEEQVSETIPEGRERRLTLRAYDYWSQTAGARAMPDLADFDAEGLAEFRASSFLIGFDEDDYLQPVYRFVGEAIQSMTGPIDKGCPVRSIAQGSVLGRVADHYLEAVAHKAPVGFDAEYERDDGSEVLYRGILLPLSADDESVDLLMGVVSWKVVPAEAPSAEETHGGSDAATPTTETVDARPAEAAASAAGGEGLQALLADCRAAAEQVKTHETRSHQALYAALARSYAFYLAACESPDSYRSLLRQAGLKAQARAPLTPLVKLVFGPDTDKARITEYAAALGYVCRQAVKPEETEAFIAGFEGGVKGLVAAERAARRAERGVPAADRAAAARRKLAEVPALAVEESGVVAPGESDYVLLLARRRSERLVEPVVRLPESAARLDAALQRAARQTQDTSQTDRALVPEQT